MKGEPKNPKLEGETELIIVCQLATLRIQYMPVDSGHAVRLVGWTYLGLSGYINILANTRCFKQFGR
jgi:hypothetical protein